MHGPGAGGDAGNHTAYIYCATTDNRCITLGNFSKARRILPRGIGERENGRVQCEGDTEFLGMNYTELTSLYYYTTFPKEVRPK